MCFGHARDQSSQRMPERACKGACRSAWLSYKVAVNGNERNACAGPWPSALAVLRKQQGRHRRKGQARRQGCNRRIACPTTHRRRQPDTAFADGRLAERTRMRTGRATRQRHQRRELRPLASASHDPEGHVGEAKADPGSAFQEPDVATGAAADRRWSAQGIARCQQGASGSGASLAHMGLMVLSEPFGSDA